VFECVRGRERETKRVGRERVRGRGGEKVGRGRCMREREREIVRGRGEREGGRRGWRESETDCERKGGDRGKGG
jgi:hypothetical protein